VIFPIAPCRGAHSDSRCKKTGGDHDGRACGTSGRSSAPDTKMAQAVWRDTKTALQPFWRARRLPIT